ncbi:cytochrome P450 6k1-like [Microplitis demolitor]|uniref:cytochrome P450 6k1-like n=1 Tax=Microplitis demolitor TaxID=69319 RepID=UPI00235B5BC0|nr:cytochrome P450 6k1-like [Microplitis demolitor]
MAVITKYWVLDSLILVFGFIVVAYLYMTRKFKYWKKRGVAEIEPTAFIGNFGDCLTAKKCAGDWLKDMYNWSAGLPYMGFYVFDRPCLLVRDPSLIKQILVKDFNYFNNRFVSASPHDRLGDANLFLIKNPQWKIVRTKLTPIYTSGRLKKMFELMDAVGNDFITLMESLELEGSGKQLELKELCARFTTELIASTAFGIRANCLHDSKAEFREKGRQIFEPSLWRNFEITSLFFAPQLVNSLKLEFVPRDSAKFLRTTLWDVINERERLGVKRGDLIDLLIELRNNKTEVFNNEFDFDGDNLLAQAVVFFNAGFETSSSALSFTLYEIALQPEIQDRLRTEIMKGLEETDGKVTYDLATSLPYLDMVISETLRKYPTLPVLDRVANDNYKIPDSNLVIEKGTPIMIPVSALQYDPEYFPNPEKYDPERFSETNKKTIKPSTYLPFGEGPHNCIGMRIGLLQVKVGLLKLLPKYEFTPCEKTLIPLRLSPKSLFTVAHGGVFLNVNKI